ELDQGDAPLIERLLNFLLTIVSLLERKHTSIRRMKELLTSLTVRPAIQPVNGAAYLTFIICRSTLFSGITRWVTSPFSFLTKVIRSSTIVRKKMVSVPANSSTFYAFRGRRAGGRRSRPPRPARPVARGRLLPRAQSGVVVPPRPSAGRP